MFLAAVLLQLCSGGVAAEETELVAVVVTKRGGVPEAKADALAQSVQEKLLASGVSAPNGPAEAAAKLRAAGRAGEVCAGKKACVAGLGKLLGVHAVVGVKLSVAGKELGIALEAVGSESAKVLAKRVFVVPVDESGSEAAKEAGAFAEELAKVLPKRVPVAEVVPPAPPPEPAPAQTEADVPAQAVEETPKLLVAEPVDATPAQASLAPVAEAEASTRRSRLPVYLAAGGAAAAGVAAAVLWRSASGEKRQVDARGEEVDGQPTSTLSFQDSTRLAQSSNRNFTAAAACGVATLALAGVAVYFGLAP